MNEPNRYEENKATFFDDNQRRPAFKTVLRKHRLPKRNPPPSPDDILDLQQTRGLRGLCKELQVHAAKYAQLADQARNARADQFTETGDYDYTDHEVAYDFRAEFLRTIIGRIKKILNK